MYTGFSRYDQHQGIPAENNHRDHSRFPPRKKRKKNNRRPTDNYQRRISYIREPAVESLFPPQLAFQPNQTEKHPKKEFICDCGKRFRLWESCLQHIQATSHMTGDLQQIKKKAYTGKEKIDEEENPELEKGPGIILVTKLRTKTRRKKLVSYVKQFTEDFHCYLTGDNTAEIVVETIASAEIFVAQTKEKPFQQSRVVMDPDKYPIFAVSDLEEIRKEKYHVYAHRKWQSNLWNITIGAQEHFSQSRPDQVEVELKNSLFELIQLKITETFYSEAVQVVLFGSIICGLDTRGSDVDVAIKIGNQDARDMPKRNQQNYLRRLLFILNQHCWVNNGQRYRFKIIPVLNAKVPILIIQDPMNDFSVDISLYREQIHVGQWINRLCEFDARVRTFLIAVKFWSKQRGVNDSKCGFINSFGFVIMGIKFLQIISPPVLPQDDIQKFVKEDTLGNTKMMFKNRNNMDMGTLLYSFFLFYYELDYKKFEISVRFKGLIEKRRDHWEKHLRRDQCALIIEDPWETENNVARNIRPHTIEILRDEFRIAAETCKTRSWQDLVRFQSMQQRKRNGKKRKRAWE